MPKGPQGQERPIDVIGCAVKVARIATGDEEETIKEKNPHAVALGKLGGAKGGHARAQKLTPERRSEIARKAIQARLNKSKK